MVKKLTFCFALLLVVSICNAQVGLVKSVEVITLEDISKGNIDLSDVLIGESVTQIGDIDNDGVVDIAINGHNSKTYKSSIYIIFLTKMGTVKNTIELTDGKNGLPTNFTNKSLFNFGHSIASIGDINGDGVNDIVVGNPGTNHPWLAPFHHKGEIYILFLASDGTVKNYTIIGENMGGFNDSIVEEGSFGWAVTGIGDFNKDGINDIAVGSPSEQGSGSRQGAVWLIYLKANGFAKSYKKIVATSAVGLTSIQNFEGFGSSLTSLGDIDNDGFEELAVGSPQAFDNFSYRGIVRVLFFQDSSEIKLVSRIGQSQSPFTDSIEANSGFGYGLANIGDLDNNGINDIAISAIRNHESRGAFWNCFLNANGEADYVQKIASDTGGLSFSFLPNERFGSGMAGLGDLDQDGYEDIIVSATGVKGNADNKGELYVVYLFNNTLSSGNSPALHNLKLYPNPTRKSLSISLPLASQETHKAEITIHDVFGKEVYREETTVNNNLVKVNVEEFSSGVYFLNLETHQGRYHQKFIVE